MIKNDLKSDSIEISQESNLRLKRLAFDDDQGLIVR